MSHNKCMRNPSLPPFLGGSPFYAGLARGSRHRPSEVVSFSDALSSSTHLVRHHCRIKSSQTCPSRDRPLRARTSRPLRATLLSLTGNFALIYTREMPYREYMWGDLIATPSDKCSARPDDIVTKVWPCGTASRHTSCAAPSRLD